MPEKVRRPAPRVAAVKAKPRGYLPVDVIRAHVEAGNGVPGRPISKGLRARGIKMGVIMGDDSWLAALEALIRSKVLHFQNLRAVISED